MKNYLLFALCTSFLFASCSKDILPTITTSTPTFESNGITWQNGIPDFNYVLTMNGDVLSGGSKTQRGYVWATQPLPTELDNVIYDSVSGNGAYRLKTKDFTFGETYFIRAFAENSMGRVYGEVQEVTAPIEYDLLQALIGTTYGGGVIAYIDASGHGLIATPSDIGTAAWGCYGIEISGADGTAIGTGNQNTIDIINGCSTAGIAARLCGDLVLGGYSDWFLPSLDEFYSLNFELTNGGYWTSTETNELFAKGIPFGSTDNAYKGNVINVRAVRAF